MPASSLLLAGVVALGFAVEAALGFGATVVALSLGLYLMSLDELLVAFLPLNLLLSTVLAVRDRRHIDWKRLGRMLPMLLLGMPIGRYLLASIEERWTKLCFAVFVIGLASIELPSVLRRTTEVDEKKAPAPRKRAALLDLGVLFAGGVAQGAFAAGGPMVVYYAGKQLGGDKRAFRATLSLLWIVLNALLVADFTIHSKFHSATIELSAMLLPSVLIGMAIGEWIHRAFPIRAFRIGVLVMLQVFAAITIFKSLN